LVAGCGHKPSGASLLCSPPECAADTSLSLVAEVEPREDSRSVPEEFASVALDASNGTFVLRLDPVVTLTGMVHVAGATPTANVPATVVATRASRIAGRPPVYYQSSVDASTGQYTLRVPRNLDGEDYTLRVSTADPTLAPPKLVTVHATDDQELDIAFEDPTTLLELRGAVYDSLKVPVASMQVQAIAPIVSATDPVVVWSTTVKTDDKGQYSLRLAPGAPATVRVVATALATPTLPSLSLDVTTNTLSPTNSPSTDLQLPALPNPAHVIYKVVGTSLSGAEMPVPQASCVFSALISDPHVLSGTIATYRATAITNANGEAAVDLVPSDNGNRAYSLSVTPDSTSQFSAAFTSVDVSPAGGYGPSIRLALRPELSGTVLDPDGKPLRNLTVVVSASSVSASLSPAYSSLAATPQTVSDVSGRFAVRVDKAEWDVDLIPPPERMLPRLWLPGTDVQSDLNVGTVVLRSGVMVRGFVRDHNNAPLINADVRLYTVPQGNNACDHGDTSCLMSPRLRAEGSSAPDGSIGFILPSQPK
jgi:hypothetical protein